MKRIYICAIVVKLLMFTSIEANAFTTAPFEEPGGGTTFFTPGGGSDFGFDDGMFFEPDRSGNLQRQTAFGQIRNFFQSSIRRSGACSGFVDQAWVDCCDDHGWDIAEDCDPDNPPGQVVDVPVGNGFLFLLAIAGLHFVIVYFRRKAIA